MKEGKFQVLKNQLKIIIVNLKITLKKLKYDTSSKSGKELLSNINALPIHPVLLNSNMTIINSNIDRYKVTVAQFLEKINGQFPMNEPKDSNT